MCSTASVQMSSPWKLSSFCFSFLASGIFTWMINFLRLEYHFELNEIFIYTTMIRHLIKQVDFLIYLMLSLGNVRQDKPYMYSTKVSTTLQTSNWWMRKNNKWCLRFDRLRYNKTAWNNVIIIYLPLFCIPTKEIRKTQLDKLYFCLTFIIAFVIYPYVSINFVQNEWKYFFLSESHSSMKIWCNYFQYTFQVSNVFLPERNNLKLHLELNCKIKFTMKYCTFWYNVLIWKYSSAI